MAYNLGSAFIEVVPSTRGLGKGIEKELGGVGGRASKQMGGKLWGGLKAGAVGAGVAIGGVLAGSVAKGFGRLRDIENAEAKLTGLGHSAESVQSIMDNALASVKGTSFGLGEAAALAGTLVASGIKPGQELEKTLRLTADSATIAGRELGDMGLIWGSVAAKGKLQGDDAMQLLSSGVPIWQMVADVMGVTAGEAQELGSKGQVSFEIFREAMEKGVGGAALESGKTTEGAFKNMGAAMGRFGATLLKDVYPLLGPLFGRITGLFDYLEGAAGPVMETITGKLTEFGRGIKGVWDILANGNFTGADSLFGFEEDSAFVGFLFGVRDVAIELYEKALKPLGTWIADNWKLIGSVLGGIAAFFVGGALVSAIGAVGGAIAAFVAGISWVGVAIGAVVGGLTYFFTQTEAGQAIVSKAWDWIQKAVAGVVDWFTTTAWPALQKGWDILKAVASEVIPVVVRYVQTLGDYWSRIFMGVILPAIQQFVGYVRDTMFPIIQRLWTDYVQPAFAAIGAFVVWAWENAIKPALSALFSFVRDTLAPTIVWLWKNVVSPMFSAIGSFIGWVWNSVIFPALDALKGFLVNVVAPAMVTLWQFAQKAWTNIQTVIRTVVGWFRTWAWPVISLVIELIKLGFNTMRAALKTAWDFIKDRVINPVVTWFRDTAWPILSTVLENIKSGFNTMRDVLKTAWFAIRDNIIAPVANWFRDKIEPLFKTATDSTGSAFTSMKDTIKKAWDGIKDAAKAPIRFVVDTVINDALIGNFNKLAEKLGTKKLPGVSLPSGFARGGVLPGMSRMSDGDDQMVPMRRGEGVLVSEGLRTAKDRAAFLAANAAGRRGIGFASLMGGGFAGGGILDKVKGLGGDALDAITSGAEWIGSALADPKGAFKKIVDGLMGQVPGAGLMRDAAIAIPKRIASEIGDKLFGAVGDGGGGSVPQSGAGGVGWARASGAASALGLRMTSGYRSGARTAGSGSRSLHSMGRARDYAGSASSMRAFFNAMDAAPYPTELLYTPMGSRNIHRGGGRYANTGATARIHRDHVHVGFRKGGIFDQGGMMQPGMTGINLTKKPEAVLDPRATRAYQAHAEAIAGGALDLSEETLEALADKLASRPNVLQIGAREFSGAVRDANSRNVRMGAR